MQPVLAVRRLQNPVPPTRAHGGAGAEKRVHEYYDISRPASPRCALKNMLNRSGTRIPDSAATIDDATKKEKQKSVPADTDYRGKDDDAGRTTTHLGQRGERGEE